MGVDDDLEISDEELKETLDSMSASDLLELSEELDIQESLAKSDGEAGRSKRGLLGLIGLKLLNKKINKIPAPVIAAGTAKLLAPKVIAPKVIGAKTAPLALAPAVLAPKAALAAKATGAKIGAKKGYLKSEYRSSSSSGSSSSSSSHSSGSSSHSSQSSSKTCSLVKKCWDKPVTKCKNNPVEK